jgi:hypothetical protein
MKKQITGTLFALVTIFVLAASAFAQTAPHIAVQIPFDFVAGGKRLPAGHYTVSRFSYSNDQELLIRSDDGHANAVIVTNPSGDNRAPQSATLSFRQHGDDYFLAAISIPGAAAVRELPESKAERRLTREVAEKSGEKTVTVAGSLR